MYYFIRNKETKPMITTTKTQEDTINWLSTHNLSIEELMPTQLMARLATTARKLPSKKESD